MGKAGKDYIHWLRDFFDKPYCHYHDCYYEDFCRKCGSKRFGGFVRFK